MTNLVDVEFQAVDLAGLKDLTGLVAVFCDPEGRMDAAARRVNTLTRKAVARLVEGDAFQKADPGEALRLTYPGGMAAEAVLVVKLPKRPGVDEARKAGVSLAKALGIRGMTVMAGSLLRAEEIVLGLALRAYRFEPHKTKPEDAPGAVVFAVSKPDDIRAASAPCLAVAEGAHFTRDLTNEPANVLTTEDFADRLLAMKDLGLSVEVLDEAALEELGMGLLLCVGQGSASPSKVVVMRWDGGGDEAPFALVGKGVVFDTGGISLKPAGGMEEMTMDMGGAGVVAGVMRALARRKARANVVGLVGLVENMPSGTATRPGDVVTAMNGTTVEVINTDAEGRLVLADVLHYTQERFKPAAMINLATLTGAIITALGHENAGVFANDDGLADAFIAAAGTEGEGAWRMPMGPAYDRALKSRIADIKNVGGRPAGAITAAQFLGRFVSDDVPWCHLDIAGTALVEKETAYAPAGATGWGVLALNRLIADRYEG